ncbi:MAG: uroporphyrinogen-III C-methyltransferase [Helicobacteraceae bacterium]|jgi:uroporphyrin-III C-methyltransferase/precorrin-2 dehydrogenase/sirohydrochlorin ferrochelatase|nr:uroporphyrinogen-III C-methyltransferase [Helicobacteraceae bacterium]
MRVLPVVLTPKKILLIGAGKAAALKARSVLESDCELCIIAREIADDFFVGRRVELKSFELADARGFEALINATGDKRLSQTLWKNRRAYGYLLNCVDEPKFCDFYFTANTRKGDLCVSVSTGGASPSYAQATRDLIAAVIEDGVCRRHEKERKGEVYLIGCGTDGIDNLTIGALKAIKRLEVALIDNLISAEIRDLLPKNCLVINVGKRKNNHLLAQEEINELIVKYARDGKIVGRLKSGDPSIFGRLREEAEFAALNGFTPRVISGVSSAFAACRAAGITPTIRGVSSGALIASAHLRGARFNDDWINLIGKTPYTIIVLMAHSFSAEILKSAKRREVSLQTPCAFTSKIGSIDETVVFGVLSDLESMAARIAKPAVLIIGECAALSYKRL